MNAPGPSPVTSVANLFGISSSSCEINTGQTCAVINSSTTCFGNQLPYNTTSFELVTDASTINQVKEKLLLWSGLEAVPRCWDVIQPLLCAVYFPQCQNGKVSRPYRSLCTITRKPCKIVEQEYGWPEFLRCENDNVYQDVCEPKLQLKFNKSDCELPLISTDNEASYYEGVEGCGLQCMNPLFNAEQHDEIHTFVAFWAAVACICTFFAMLSFFIDWKNSSKYPARIIFYINACFFVGGIGWLAQFFPGAREEIVCRKDGTMRLAEPRNNGESPSCVIVFVVVYYSLMAGITWFDILSYSWYLMFQALGTSKDPLKGKEHKFHLVAWSVPFILMIGCLASSQIDGDSMSGICFVGYKNHMYRLGFLLVPVGIVLVIGSFFLCKGLIELFSIRRESPGLLSDSAIAKINWTMIRIGIFTVLALAFVLVTFAVHVYDYTHQATWESSFRDYIKCNANVTILEKLSGSAPTECHLLNRPSLAVIKIHLVAMFGTGIVMSTWVWTKASAANWKRAWFKLIGRSDNETKRIRHRSKMIAKAFALRNMFRRTAENPDEASSEEDGPDIEYSEHTMTHQDPIGMDFDLHSLSQEMSSTWLRHVPKMVFRRGAMLPEDRGRIDPHHHMQWLPPTKSRPAANGDGDILEPGLWAVSQYIDGRDLKTRKDKVNKNKTAPSKNQSDMFIGTSPYKFPGNSLYHYHDNPTYNRAVHDMRAWDQQNECMQQDPSYLHCCTKACRCRSQRCDESSAPCDEQMPGQVRNYQSSHRSTEQHDDDDVTAHDKQELSDRKRRGSEASPQRRLPPLRAANFTSSLSTILTRTNRKAAPPPAKLRADGTTCAVLDSGNVKGVGSEVSAKQR